MEEHGFSDGCTNVKDCVQSAQLYSREIFIPLTHPPGEAQACFGEALVGLPVVQKAHHRAVDLPHSGGCFVAAFPAETPGAFLEGHVRAFVDSGGLPRILNDNSRMDGCGLDTRR